jgi:hypothetical protein
MTGKPTAAALLGGVGLDDLVFWGVRPGETSMSAHAHSCMHTRCSACFLSRHEWGRDPRWHRGWRFTLFGCRNRRKSLHLGQRAYSVTY